jgi:hypothetical protein
MDIVYTWVDDRFPGYLEELHRHAGSSHDTNPNRTRDNLDLLRYSLRSLVANAPWAERVFLVTARPQVPAWLAVDCPRLRLVHHDEIIDRDLLPTYSSFAILSHLTRIPGLGRRFLYLEDDMLFGAPVSPADFIDADGIIRVYQRLSRTPPPGDRDRRDISPWNAALARCNHLLDAAFAPARRRHVNHVPLCIDRELWDEMLARWPQEAGHTRHSRFRASGNIAPEYLYPHYLVATGRGRMLPTVECYRRSFYFGLENWLPWSWLGSAAIATLRPGLIALNDNFGDAPNPAVVAHWRRFLERRYPRPSVFERAASA